MKFRDYWLSLNSCEKRVYADHVGTTVKYIRHHYMQLNRRPTPYRLNKMVKASNGEVSEKEMIAHFKGA